MDDKIIGRWTAHSWKNQELAWNVNHFSYTFARDNSFLYDDSAGGIGAGQYRIEGNKLTLVSAVNTNSHKIIKISSDTLHLDTPAGNILRFDKQ